ncbi:hypothetical protein V499_08253 [Pseudogymnoascus sp. VKM F-103]|nr:hypothetical protein V499_08253 [Pseudogymnoascus sp. VKM F-103]
MSISTADLSATAELPSPTTTPILTPETAYLDIIGAAVNQRKPRFASTYNCTLSSSSPYSLGLYLYNGCDDRVLYTISCISSMIELRYGLDAHQLSHCAQVFNQSLQHTTSPAQERMLSQIQAGATFAEGYPVQPVVLTNLSFHLAARIYALGVLGRYARRSDSIRPLVSYLAGTLALLSRAYQPVDNGLMWTYIVGGAASVRGDAFRVSLADNLGRQEKRCFRDLMRKFVEVWEKDEDTREGMGEWVGVV